MEQKTTWMLLLAFGILSSLLLQACRGDVDTISLFSYRYVNETNHIIEIKRWRKNVETTYNLAPSGKIEFKKEAGMSSLCSVNGIKQNNGYCALIYSDSLRITFNGLKSYLLKPPSNGRTSMTINILDFVNYASTDITPCDYNDCTHGEYRFTEKDYQYAK